MVNKLYSDIEFIMSHKKKRGLLGYLACLLSPSFICILIYRISHKLYCFKVPVVPRFFWWINFLLFKVDIDQRACLYSSLYLPHPMNIVIGADVKSLGKMKIMQSVTIGGNLGQVKKDDLGINYTQPIFNGTVFVGINALIIGPVIVKGRVFISAGSHLSLNVENKMTYSINKFSQLKERYEAELL